MKNSATTKRVGIIGIHHESNTFIPSPTTLELYRSTKLIEGNEIRELQQHAHHEIGGFLEVLDKEGFEAVPLVFARTSPWGKVTDEALDTIWSLVVKNLKNAGHLDGILVAPHGAGVNESRPDMDGWWLMELRKMVGPEMPIIETNDPHANLSAAMVAACDSLTSYRENPHLDQRQRGIEAATMMVRTLKGEVRPVVAASFPPVAMNIERQLSFAEPMLSVKAELEKTRALPGVLSASVNMGYPYADVFDMGTSFVVVTDNDKALAQREADRLGQWLIDHRELFRGEMISPEEAIERAKGAPKPVGLLDMGDNMGGGAPADSTLLAQLLESQTNLKTLVVLADPESVEQAAAAGLGARLHLKIGGKLPMTPAPPIETEVTVIRFHDGIYTETKPRHGGAMGGNMGPTVVVKTDKNLTAILTTRRVGPASAQPVYSCGLDPKDFDVVIIKGVHAPIGAYAEICSTLIRVNTPGSTIADMHQLTYHNIRKPLFPLQAI